AHGVVKSGRSCSSPNWRSFSMPSLAEGGMASFAHDQRNESPDTVPTVTIRNDTQPMSIVARARSHLYGVPMGRPHRSRSAAVREVIIDTASRLHAAQSTTQFYAYRVSQ